MKYPVVGIFDSKLHTDFKVINAHVSQIDEKGLIKISGEKYIYRWFDKFYNKNLYGFLWWRFFFRKVKAVRVHDYLYGMGGKYVWVPSNEKHLVDFSISPAWVHIPHNETLESDCFKIPEECIF